MLSRGLAMVVILAQKWLLVEGWSLLERGQGEWAGSHKVGQENRSVAGENRNAMEVVKLVLPPELIGQVIQMRKVPVVMVGKRAVKDRDGGSN